MELDVLRRQAESEKQIGAGSPEASVPFLRIQNAAPSRQEKSLVLATTPESLSFSNAAMTMRRLFGFYGAAGRQEILAAEDAEES